LVQCDLVPLKRTVRPGGKFWDSGDLFSFPLDTPESKPFGLGSRIWDVAAFWYKNHLLCAIVCDFMVYPDPKFIIFKTKKQLHFSLRFKANFFMILCYHARHLLQIHWSKLLCGMYGFMAKSSVSRLNICRILMRYVNQSGGQIISIV
jgi:hypothetical protein